MVNNILALQLTNLHTIKRDIIIEVLRLDQAIISNDRNILSMSLRDNRGRRRAIVSTNHQNTITVRQIGLSLAELYSRTITSIVIINMNTRNSGTDRLHEQRMILRLPTHRRSGSIGKQDTNFCTTLPARKSRAIQSIGNRC